MPRLIKQAMNLLNGVSQQPDTQRDASQAEEQVNLLSSPTLGLTKRPWTAWVAKLSGSTTVDTAFVHAFKNEDGTPYHAVVTGGDVQVFEAETGTNVPVIYKDPGSAGEYLASDAKGYRALTEGDTTYLLNRDVTVQKFSATAATRGYEAMVYVKQGDYSTPYTITLESVTVTHTSHATDKAQITTAYIVNALKTLLAASALASSYDFVLYGSAMHIRRKDQGDFTLSTSDGLGDKGMAAIKGSVQQFTDLPPKAPAGFTVEVTGSAESAADNYWVTFEYEGWSWGPGVWKECAKPGSQLGFNTGTMPHRLIYKGAVEEDLVNADCAPDVGAVNTGTVSALYFQPLAMYPIGSVISVQLSIGPQTFAYTVSAFDKDGATVASALQALIDADPNWVATSPSSGVVEITHAPVAAFTATPTVTFDNLTRCYIPDKFFTPLAYVGKSVRNVTDGSTGIITSNTAHVLVCAGGLTGGSDDSFEPNDQLEIIETGEYFLFTNVEWDDRAAGDDTSNPFPSIVNHDLTDIFTSQSRLGLLTKSSVVLSEAGKFTNLFRTTVTDVIASDPIDATSSTANGSLESAVVWNGWPQLFSNTGSHLELSGDPVLSPSTVRLDRVGKYPNPPQCPPLASGRSLFIATKNGQFVRVSELRNLDSTERPEPVDTTRHVPKYLAGAPTLIVGDSDLGFVAVLTDYAYSTNVIGVYCYTYDGDQKVQASWSKWAFAPGLVLSLGVIDGYLVVVSRHSDGVHLHRLSLRIESPESLVYDGTIAFGGDHDFLS